MIGSLNGQQEQTYQKANYKSDTVWSVACSLYRNARATLAVDTPTFFAIAHSDQTIPPIRCHEVAPNFI